jgi:carboxypeptidase family protein
MMMRKVELILLAMLLGTLCVSICCAPDIAAQTPPHATAASAILCGKVTMGPTMPVERAGGPAAIAPVAGASVNVTSTVGVPIASATTGADGFYSIPLTPGDYLVTVTPPRRMLRRFVPRQVTVAPGAPTVLDLTLDTGIR